MLLAVEFIPEKTEFLKCGGLQLCAECVSDKFPDLTDPEAMYLAEVEDREYFILGGGVSDIAHCGSWGLINSSRNPGIVSQVF